MKPQTICYKLRSRRFAVASTLAHLETYRDNALKFFLFIISTLPMSNFLNRPYIRIIEQPQKSLRFRYQCEKRTGTIPGASSTSTIRTLCAIQIVGYQGRIAVVVSCVTKEEPYKPHPHKLVGEHCKRGVCSFEAEVTPNNPDITFRKLGVQCVKKNELKESLSVREESNIDPFSTGFLHKDHLNCIDLNVVRLCFQVFLIDENRRFTPVSPPVVSDPIYNRKTFPDPDIFRLSHCNTCVNGGKTDIILLCPKVDKDDIRIRIYEVTNGQTTWQEFVTGDQMQIYSSTAICFKPPPYKNLNIVDPAPVFMQLIRPSDGVVSKSVQFEYLPLDAEKRKKCQDMLPLFAQLLDDPGPSHAMSFENLPNFSSGDINIESASGISKLLNIDCHQIELEPINISSGDLEMFDVNKLSGNLQENLSLSDVLV
ncbi:embryonic polarity protein dorsal-like isoform X2 [Tribolium madens]|uniref:embryonic polarity protein dorsal-like isoform X2 n=1 Tax=Tribolium madens TaxID=41895 RepID=UPI001CF751F2|nr:embryonic polarity protein dorsal-like isoform X2 [Tribolium madens]